MRVALDRKQIAEILEEIGILLELKGENPYKSRAYSNAARTLESLNDDLDTLVREDRVQELKGIGEALAEKIITLVKTGKLPYHDDLRREIPAGLLEIIQIPGLGPKRARVLHEKLGIATVDELESACRQHRLEEVSGFTRKTQQSILEGIAFFRQRVGKMRLDQATPLAGRILESVGALRGVARAEIAGSLRRRKETIRDIDILAACRRGFESSKIIAQFVELSDVRKVIGAGDTKASVLIESGRQVDLRVVAPEEFPFALHYFTGSAEHNIAIRRRAQDMGFKINEYGLWKGEERIACDDEAGIFERLGLAFIPPELREDWGEIEAAGSGSLPSLVSLEDIRGVLHVHTTWSDGIDSLEEMVRKAADMGYEYVGISDHSRSAGYAGGLSIERIEQQRTEIGKLREKYPKLTILHGTESDILRDGSLDYPDEVLVNLDFVVGSVHSSFMLDEAEQTNRVVKAMDNPRLTLIGHPTGRLLLQRDGFRIDMQRVLEAAARHGKCLEVNANPHRLDLDWRACRQARDLGVRLFINPDAHRVDGLEDTRFGVDTARRGWLQADDIVNTRPWSEIEKMMEMSA